MSNVRTKIGDIIEIRTSLGLCYAVYTNKHSDPPKFGALIRVFDETYRERPLDITELLRHRIRFSTFFPLQAAVNRGLVTILGQLELPEQLLSFPIFRSGIMDPETKKVSNWWLWDGKTEWRIGTLSPEQRKFPIRGIWNYAYLVNKLEEGWRPETDPQ